MKTDLNVGNSVYKTHKNSVFPNITLLHTGYCILGTVLGRSFIYFFHCSKFYTRLGRICACARRTNPNESWRIWAKTNESESGRIWAKPGRNRVKNGRIWANLGKKWATMGKKWANETESWQNRAKPKVSPKLYSDSGIPGQRAFW